MTANNKDVFFTVIIPFYNESVYIKDTIISVLNQQFMDFELLCINDGSTDDSEKIILNNSIGDGRVKIIRQHHFGKCVARNTGLKQAQGQWICFLNSGDVFYQNHLRIFSELISKNINCQVFCTSEFNGQNFNAFKSNKFYGNILNLTIEDFLEYDKFSLNQFCFKSNLIRRNLFPSMNLIVAEEILVLRQIVAEYNVIFQLTVTNASKLKTRYEKNTLKAIEKVNWLKLSSDIFINNSKPERKVARTIQCKTRFKSLKILYYYREYWNAFKLLING